MFFDKMGANIKVIVKNKIVKVLIKFKADRIGEILIKIGFNKIKNIFTKVLAGKARDTNKIAIDKWLKKKLV